MAVARAVAVLADGSFCNAPDDDKFLRELLIKYDNFTERRDPPHEGHLCRWLCPIFFQLAVRVKMLQK